MLFSAVNDQNIPLWKLVIEGKKTQTRRPLRIGDTMPAMSAVLHEQVRSANGHIRYEVGRTYAVQMKRGTRTLYYDVCADGSYIIQPSNKTNAAIQGLTEARIKIVELRREDVRDISEDDAKAEGFSGRGAFWDVWWKFYDPIVVTMPGEVPVVDRPAELYQAWALTFEVVS